MADPGLGKSDAPTKQGDRPVAVALPAAEAALGSETELPSYSAGTAISASRRARRSVRSSISASFDFKPSLS